MHFLTSRTSVELIHIAHCTMRFYNWSLGDSFNSFLSFFPFFLLSSYLPSTPASILICLICILCVWVLTNESCGLRKLHSTFCVLCCVLDLTIHNCSMESSTVAVVDVQSSLNIPIHNMLLPWIHLFSKYLYKQLLPSRYGLGYLECVRRQQGKNSAYFGVSNLAEKDRK